MLIGYARVSKSETQDTAPQIRTLKDAGCTRLFEEAASGGRWERPELGSSWNLFPKRTLRRGGRKPSQTGDSDPLISLAYSERTLHGQKL